MATNLSIDPDLIERALKVSGERTKKAAVTKALEEFIARRRQKRLLDLMGKLEWDSSYDYKAERDARLSLFVDTSVWSLAFRRDTSPSAEEATALIRAIETGETILTTGLVLQEFLQGFSGPKARAQILDRFSALPLLVPDRDDHIRAADLRNRCRRRGSQVGTIDALLAQLVHSSRPDDAHNRQRFRARCRPLRAPNWNQP